MADIWPIENVWAILKDRVKEKEPKTKAELKKVIIKVWKGMDRAGWDNNFHFVSS